jgi:hypothetical protein
MSMILLEPANTILQTSGEDQAADHLINGVSGQFNPATCRKADFSGALITAGRAIQIGIFGYEA